MIHLSYFQKNNKGFSLIEIIMVLVLLGIMGALGSVGISSFIEIFSRSKQSNEAVSAGQIAILRIGKELIAANKLYINESTSSQIKFDTKHNNNQNYTITITKDAGGIVSINGDKLVESVQNLEFTYYVWDADNTTNPFQPHDPLWTSDRCSLTIAKAKFNQSDNSTGFAFTTTSSITPIPPANTGKFKIIYNGNTQLTTTISGSDNTTFSNSSPLHVCDYAYLYAPTRGSDNETMCFFKITISNTPAHASYPDNDPCYSLPSMTDITGHTVTRIIKVTLKMMAYDAGTDPYELSIMVSPRNIN